MKNRMPRSSMAKRSLQKFLSNRIAIVGAALLLVLLLSSLLAPLLTPYDPTFIDPAQKSLPPSWAHPLGTDGIGRDLFARLLYGGRISIFVGIVSACGAVSIGVILGCISGYYGKFMDKFTIYLSELFMAFPETLLVLIFVGFAGRGIQNLIIIFMLTGWGSSFRLVRSQIISLKNEPFVESCRVNGISGWSIMFRQLLPNTLGPVIVYITLGTAGYVLAEAGLSFLGLGIPTDIPSWGNIINASKRLDIIQTQPLLWIAPGVTISLFVLAVNFFGDGLRDVFDPT